MLFLHGGTEYALASKSNQNITFLEYFELIESLEDDSSSNQITQLTSFLEDYPNFELVYVKLFNIYLSHDKISEAKTYFEQLIKRPEYFQKCCWILAKIYNIQGDPQNALAHYQKALSSKDPSNCILIDFFDFLNQTKKLNILKQLKLTAHPDLIDAIYQYKKLNYEAAIINFKRLPQQVLLCPEILFIFGDCYYRSLALAQCDSVWKIGLAHSRSIGDKHAEAKFLMNIGAMNNYSGKKKDALEYYKITYELAGRIGDNHRKQLVAGNQGMIYQSQGEYEKAKSLFDEAISISIKLNDFSDAGYWCLMKGWSCFSLGKFNEALAAASESEKYALKTNDMLTLFELKLLIGDIYNFLKQNVLAKKNYQEALSFAVTKNFAHLRQRAKVRLADLYFNESNFEAAREIYRNYIQYLYKNNRDSVMISYLQIKIADTYFKTNNLEHAKIECQRAFEIAGEAKSVQFMAWALIRMGNIEIRNSEIDSAFSYFSKVIKMSREIKSFGLLPETYMGIGDAYRKMSDIDSAIHYYKKAAIIIEENRQNLSAEQLRIGYFSEEYKVYKNLVSCYYKMYKKDNNDFNLDSLFNYCQMARSRALKDVGSKTSLKTVTKDQIVRDYLMACEELKHLQRQIRDHANLPKVACNWDSLLARLNVVRYSLIQQRLRMIDRESANKPAEKTTKLMTLTKLLDTSNLGLLMYHIWENESFAFVIAHGKKEIVPLNVSLEDLKYSINELLSPFHGLNKNEQLQQVPFRAQIAFDLYEQLILPVEDKFILPERLIVLSDLDLANLPFEMLLFKKPDKPQYTPLDIPAYKEDFLLRRYSFSYVPSISQTNLKSKKTFSAQKILVFANPINENVLDSENKIRLRSSIGWRFEPLIYADREARSIKTFYPTTQIVCHEQATKSNFLKLAPNFQVLHLATHGFVDLSFDLFSGLVFAPQQDSADDGLFMGYEITDMKLPCELISLSACETGRGKVIAGEGVLGLPRLFLKAGAKAVLMTKWKVDDRFSSLLMPTFYRFLFEQEKSKDVALSRAKLELIDNSETIEGIHFQHPIFWAAFTLYGSPNSIKVFPVRAMIILLVFVIGFSVILGIFLKRLRRKRY